MYGFVSGPRRLSIWIKAAAIILLVQFGQQKGLEAFAVEVQKPTELFLPITLVAARHRPESHLARVDAIIRTEQIHTHTLEPPPKRLRYLNHLSP